MTRTRLTLLTALAMLSFAGNSILCRLALHATQIDAATFTAVRLVSGALVLWLIVRVRDGAQPIAGTWSSAAALFTYAAAFSYAYVSLSAGTGALILFATVQATMIGYGLLAGERPSPLQAAGLVLALGGLVGLLLPGLTAPPLGGAALMVAAGIAWGVYTLRGGGAGDATRITAGNFIRAAPLAIALGAAMLPWASADTAGVIYAIASGAIASGGGYVIWYAALRGLSATSAACIQLSVPVIAAAGGIVFLNETLTLRLAVASAVILGGVAIAIRRPRA